MVKKRGNRFITCVAFLPENLEKVDAVSSVLGWSRSQTINYLIELAVLEKIKLEKVDALSSVLGWSRSQTINYLIELAVLDRIKTVGLRLRYEQIEPAMEEQDG